MRIASDFLAALIRGKITMENVDGTKGWVPLTHIKLLFTKGDVVIHFYKDKILVATRSTAFDPTSVSVLTLAANNGFTMNIEVEINE